MKYVQENENRHWIWKLCERCSKLRCTKYLEKELPHCEERESLTQPFECHFRIAVRWVGFQWPVWHVIVAIYSQRQNSTNSIPPIPIRYSPSPLNRKNRARRILPQWWRCRMKRKENQTRAIDSQIARVISSGGKWEICGCGYFTQSHLQWAIARPSPPPKMRPRRSFVLENNNKPTTKAKALQTIQYKVTREIASFVFVFFSLFHLLQPLMSELVDHPHVIVWNSVVLAGGFYRNDRYRNNPWLCHIC